MSPLLLPFFFLLLLLLPSPSTSLSKKTFDKSGLPSDVPFIQCAVCPHVSRASVLAANDLPVTRSFDTLSVLDAVESLCTPDRKPGRWMKHIDLVERPDATLDLVKHDAQQACKRECRTLALACRRVLEDVETELAERLYAIRKRGVEVAEEDVQDWLCAREGGLSSVCRGETPKLPEGREAGPPFVPKEEKDANMENLMEEIRAANPDSGMGLDMMQPGGVGMDTDEEDYDDDEDDDEDKDDDEEEDMGDAEDMAGAAENGSDPGLDADSAGDGSLSFADAGEVGGIQPGNGKAATAPGSDEL